VSDIKIVKTHSLPLAQAKSLVTKAAKHLSAEYGLTSEWHGNTLRFHRAGVDGKIAVTESKIRLEAKLGLLVTPMKGKIVEYIENQFDTAVAGTKSVATKPKTDSKSTAAKKKTRARD
jgi:putative polyhydroxyalkanoate system protein